MELQLAEAVAQAIGTEYLRASVNRPQLRSAHEGAAILKEKYDILWEEVKRLNAERLRAAAVKLAATALRFVVDTCPPAKTPDNGRWKCSRKPLDSQCEKEIAAFEGWQMSEWRQAGCGSQEFQREEHRPRDGQSDQNTKGHSRRTVCGARLKKPRCRTH